MLAHTQMKIQKLSRCGRLLLAAFLAVAPAAAAQHALAADPSLAYDVVSIKVNKTGGGSTSINSSLEHFAGTNVTLKDLIRYAYDLRSDDQIAGLAGPANSARFDMEAKVDADTLAALKKLEREPRTAQQRALMRAMLADRFQLKVHRETREGPVYGLVVAKGGFKLTAVDPVKPEAGAPPDPKYSPGSMNTSVSNRDGKMTAQAVPLSNLAESLARQVSRMVVDKTGLTGKYDFTLAWTDDQNSEAKDDTASAPSLFTALQEQLGLKLEAMRGPVETIVVDRAEMPSEN